MLMEALLHHTGLKALRGCALEGGNLKGHKRVKLQKTIRWIICAAALTVWGMVI